MKALCWHERAEGARWEGWAHMTGEGEAAGVPSLPPADHTGQDRTAWHMVPPRALGGLSPSGWEFWPGGHLERHVHMLSKGGRHYRRSCGSWLGLALWTVFHLRRSKQSHRWRRSSPYVHFFTVLSESSRLVAHLASVLVGVHPTVSLGLVLTESLQHVLDLPKFFLKENVLLAGRLHLVNRKHTPTQVSVNFPWISCDNRVAHNDLFCTSRDRLVWEWKVQVTCRLLCSVIMLQHGRMRVN